MLFQPFIFPNGQTAKNRFFKSAMEEQLAQNDKPTQNLVNLYRTWAQLDQKPPLVNGKRWFLCRFSH